METQHLWNTRRQIQKQKQGLMQRQNSHAAKNKGMYWDGFVLAEEGEVSIDLSPQVKRCQSLRWEACHFLRIFLKWEKYLFKFIDNLCFSQYKIPEKLCPLQRLQVFISSEIVNTFNFLDVVVHFFCLKIVISSRKWMSIWILNQTKKVRIYCKHATNSYIDTNSRRAKRVVLERVMGRVLVRFPDWSGSPTHLSVGEPD